MTFSAKDLQKLGLPLVKPVLDAGLRAANIAVHSGFDRNDIVALTKQLAVSPAPQEIELGDLAAIFSPLAQELAAMRDRQVLFTEREQPAPWKSWCQDDIEAMAVEQMTNACRLPVAVGGALMPDAHPGYGLPIGGVLAVHNAVIPYGVGVDIACRMRLTVLNIPYEEFERDDARFEEALEAETRFGIGAAFELGERRTHPVMEEDWDFDPVTKALKGKAAKQLGTSGSGNHFVEFGRLTVTDAIDEPTIKLKAGTYLALLSHSGSRGLGQEIAQYYSKLAMSLHPELPQELRHLAWLGMDTPEGQAYWRAMQLAGRYASANHQLVHEHVLAHLGAQALGFVENHHNFAWKETYGGEEVIVHRKGATPAAEGVLGIVPGSMATPGFIVRGKGAEDSFRSCSHGSGRRMSRAQAFQKLSKEKMMEILQERGVRLLSGPLDESPEVYKDIEKVIASQTDLVDVLARFDPKLVKMAPQSPVGRFGKRRPRRVKMQCA